MVKLDFDPAIIFKLSQQILYRFNGKTGQLFHIRSGSAAGYFAIIIAIAMCMLVQSCKKLIISCANVINF
jgi:hypothetical protein